MGGRKLGIAVALAALAGVARAGTIYVDADAWGANNGLSWFDAFNSLTVALGVASSGDEVWVAEGTYKPLGRDYSFEIPPGVKVFGGFRGTEVDHDQRDPAAHITTLDGDLNDDDEPGFLHRSDNCRHVVWAESPTPGTVLDGFVIAGGYAVDEFNSGVGGGLHAHDGSMKVAQCVFIANGAGDLGGGASFGACNEIRVYDCLFTGNATHPDSGQGDGGGIYFIGDTLDVQRSTFLLNAAYGTSIASGGALYAAEYGEGLPLEVSVRDCEFTANIASAGSFSNGGACGVQSGTTVRFTRCTFNLNQVGDSGPISSGGAIWAAANPGPPNECSVVACRLIGNSAAGAGSAIFAETNLELSDSLVDGNTGSAAVVCSQILILPTVTVTGTTIVGNSHGGAGPAGIVATVDLAIADSILWGNTNGSGGGQGAQVDGTAGLNVSHSCVEGWDGSISGTGSFDADPRFMDANGADNVAGTLDDDYRLRGRSPCIDAGDNTAVPADGNDLDDDGNTGEKLPLDLDLNPRRLDDTGTSDSGVGNAPFVDLGAYEFQGTSCVGDFDGNGVVDTRDVIFFLGAWAAGNPSADIDGNGVIDSRDVLAFLNAWAQGC